MEIKCKEIVFLNINELIPYPDNDKIHPRDKRLEDRLEKIFKSEQGFTTPIKIDAESKTITCGHARWRVLKKLNIVMVPCVPIKYKTKDLMIADIIADNATNEWRHIERGAVNEILPDFDGMNFDIDLFGIDDFELEPFDKYADKDADSVPELPKEAKSKVGDLYILGNHRLLCGDATSKEDVDRLMDGNKADMVFTDPPYGVSYTKKNEYLNSLGKPMSYPKAIENDEKSIPEMFELWKNIFNLSAEFCNNKSSYYICSPQGGELMMMMQAIDQSPWSLKHTLIWNKNNHVLGRCDYHYKHEPILYGWKKKGSHEFFGKGSFTKSVWDIAKPHNSDLHPTMKPIELMENALLNSSKIEMNVLDLFGGSGSTLIACEKTNRKCYMMELEPLYVSVILNRWCEYTGEEAYLIDGNNKTSWSEIKGS